MYEFLRSIVIALIDNQKIKVRVRIVETAHTRMPNQIWAIACADDGRDRQSHDASPFLISCGAPRGLPILSDFLHEVQQDSIVASGVKLPACQSIGGGAH